MSPESMLKNLSIRLTYLGDDTDDELNRLLDELRNSLKDGCYEDDIRKLSDRLTKKLMLNEQASTASQRDTGINTTELVPLFKALKLGGNLDSKLAKLTDKLVALADGHQQLGTLKEIFTLIQESAKKPLKEASKGKGLGWFDRKSRKIDESWLLFFDKTAELLGQVVDHVDVLQGNTADTRYLRERIEQLGNAAELESLEVALEDTIVLLGNITEKMRKERMSTQEFLGDLRDKLHSVEGVIYSLISDGDQSLDRAADLEKQVQGDVEDIGQAVEAEDLKALQATMEQRLSKLTSHVSDYLSAEQEHHQSNQAKVKDLTRKVREMEMEASHLRSEIKSKQDMALKDPLTGVYNRAGYEARVEEEFSRIKRVKSPLSIVFVDCNKFKQINDNFGHDAGDVVLVQVAKILASRARASDVVARYGGDEFVVLLPDTPVEGAEIFAKDAYNKVIEAGFNNNGTPLDVSISCGVTEVGSADTHATAIKRADEAMYRAKKQPGIRVVVAPV